MKDIKGIVKQLTLDEKLSLLSGKDFWTTCEVERLGIPSIMLTDGPHGLRKQDGESDHLGLNGSVPATCFPSGSALASSWDKGLIEEVGVALGKEAQTENVSVLLGPGVNIKRSPLCGRNFEYYSEDPYLSTHMAMNFINGVQSQGVGTSIKHFAVNNQEYKRMSVDTIVDERTLREIYLASFETAIKEAKPWTVMSAYNQLNGEFCSDNKRLLTDILRNEWGYEGIVVSDWGAEQNRVKGILAGMDLEMPSSNGLYIESVKAAIDNNEIPMEQIDLLCERLIGLAIKATEQQVETSYDKVAHDHLAKRVASECAVLLKNENNILPLQEKEKVAIIGELAIRPRYQGGGSSHINPNFIHSAWKHLESKSCTFAQGYELDSDDQNNKLVNDALEVAKANDKVVVFAGLPDRYESEGYDRNHLQMPKNQVQLIEELAKVNSDLVIVLANGSPIEMPWKHDVKAILEGYLGGQAGGAGIVDVLYGNVNPSGKLAETFPLKLEHNPSMLFQTEGNAVTYKEGIYLGYRYYDKKKMDTLFPFGYGLSYTEFEYLDIATDKERIKDTETMTVTVKVKNVGSIAGKEVVQLYVRDLDSTIHRPVKELKGFSKVFLEAGEEKSITFTLDKRSFAYYNVDINDWHVETGEFEILVGSSSVELPLSQVIHVESTVELKKVFTQYSTIKELMEHPIGRQIGSQIFSSFSDGMDMEEAGFGDTQELMTSLTLNALKSFGAMTDEQLEGMLQQLNA